MSTSFNPMNHPILFSQPKRLTPLSAWHEHIPAAMFLIDLLKPDLLVELGTHYGDSYCAFCQAVQELHLSTRCYAVDTWQGDAQTGFYGPEVLADLQAHHDPLYGSFSELVQSTFDEALSHFSAGTIDLLHIDGYHTYEAVKHDFECWFPKLSSRAVVLFHDINVRNKDFGVWRLWDDLKSRYPYFEFLHGHGLGVLAVGKERSTTLDFLAVSGEEAGKIRTLLFELGYRLELQVQLAAQGVERERAAQTLNAQTAERDQAVQTLSSQLAERDQAVQTLTAQLAENEQATQARLAEKERGVQALNAQLEEKERGVQALNAELGEKERAIQALQQTVEEQTKHLDALVARIEFMSSRESELHGMLLDAHEQLVRRDNEIQQLRPELRQREAELRQREAELRQREVELRQRDAEVQGLRSELEWLQDRLRHMQATRIWRLGLLYWRAHAWIKARLPR